MSASTMTVRHQQNTTVRIVKALAKWAFVIGLFVYLGKKGLVSGENLRLAFAQPRHIALAWGLFVFSWLLGTSRWYFLMQARAKHRIGYFKAIQMGLIGNFFSVALPGAVSGDFVKAYYVAHEIKERTSSALSSVVMDRIVGLGALTWVAAIGVLSTLHWNIESAFMMPLRGFVLSTAMLFLLFFAYLFLVRGERDPVARVLHRLASRHEKLGSLERTYTAIKSFDQHPKTVVMNLVISTGVHLSTALGFLICADALGDATLPLRAFTMLVPVGMLVTAIPLTPAGVGTGHAAFLALFKLVESEHGADLFSIYVLLQLLIGAAGGVAYLLYRKPIPTEENE